jgi:hypothetical protein
MVKCSCYQIEEIIYKNRYNNIQYVETKHICNGTKERDECSCGGDRLKCSFYPEVRLKAAKEVGCEYLSSDSTQKPINSELEILELKEKVRALETQNKTLKKSNKNWRRKVQRLRNSVNKSSTEKTEFDFSRELKITRQFILDNDLLYELALYSKKFEK